MNFIAYFSRIIFFALLTLNYVSVSFGMDLDRGAAPKKVSTGEKKAPKPKKAALSTVRGAGSLSPIPTAGKKKEVSFVPETFQSLADEADDIRQGTPSPALESPRSAAQSPTGRKSPGHRKSPTGRKSPGADRKSPTGRKSPKDILADAMFADVPRVDSLLLFHQAISDGHLTNFLNIFKENKTPEFVTKPDSAGRAALHFAASCQSAHQKSFIKTLLQNGASVDDLTGYSDDESILYQACSPLHLAVAHDCKDVAECLLKDYKAPLLYTTPRGVAVDILQVARDLNKPSMIALCLEYGVNDVKAPITPEGFTALHLAAAYNLPGTIDKLMARGAVVDTQADNGDVSNPNHRSTPLIFAVTNGWLDIVKKLVLQYHADPNLAGTQDYTPLQEAMMKRQPAIAEFLLLEQKAAIPKTNFSYVHWASQPGFEKILQKFLDLGFESYRDREGFLPIHDAARTNAASIIKIFIDRGIDLEEQVHAENKEFAKQFEGATPLYLAAEAGALETVRMLLETKKVNVNHRITNGMTPFLASLQLQKPDIALLLLEHGAKIDAMVSDNGNALHILAKNPHLFNVFKIVFERMPTLNAPSLQGYKPIHLAASVDNVAVVDFLITECKEPFYVRVQAADEKNVTKNEGKTPLTMAAAFGGQRVAECLMKKHRVKDPGDALLLATDNKHEQLAQFFIPFYNQVGLNACFNNGRTALHCAAQYNLVAVAENLINADAKRTVTDREGLTPLHIAAINNARAVAELLVRQGLSINKPALLEDGKLAHDQKGTTPLMCAAGQKDSFDVLEYFLTNRKSKLDIDAVNQAGHTALYLAAVGGCSDNVGLLLQYGASMNVRTKTGVSVVDAAAEHGHENVIEKFLAFFLEKCEGDEEEFRKLLPTLWADEKNPKNGTTPLLLAAAKNRTKIVELLLKTGIDVKAKNKDNGWNALHYAAAHGNDTMVMMLLAKEPTLLNTETYDGETPLFIACKKNRAPIVAILHEVHKVALDTQRSGNTALSMAVDNGCHDTVELLLKALKADPNKTIRKGFYALHCAAAKNDIKSAQLLLEHKALVSAKSQFGYQPIHTAASHGHAEMLNFLIEAKVPVDEQVVRSVQNNEFNFFTPLMFAVSNGKIVGVRTLLKHKANVNYATPLGITPLHVATQKGLVKIATLLCAHGADGSVKTKDGQTPLQLAPGHLRHELEKAIENGCAAWKAKLAGTALPEEDKDGDEPESKLAVDDDETAISMDAEDDDKESVVLRTMNKKAKKQFKALDDKIALSLQDKIHELLTHEKGTTLDIKKLADRENLWRLKVGRDLPRVIYYQDPKTNEIVITEIGDRKNIYNKV